MKVIRNTQFQLALPRLLDAYDHGRLVPFLGAGASVPACSLWPEFVANLERLAGLGTRHRDGRSVERQVVGSQELIRLAADAVRRLKNERKISFNEAIKSAIVPRNHGSRRAPGSPVPPVIEALA